MKRQYIQPQTVAVVMKMSQMLCSSPTGGTVYGIQADNGSVGFSREFCGEED